MIIGERHREACCCVSAFVIEINNQFFQILFYNTVAKPADVHSNMVY